MALVARVQTHGRHSDYNLQREPTLKGIHVRITAPPKERNTHPIPDDYYIKSICPSGGHGRGKGPPPLRLSRGHRSSYKTGRTARLETRTVNR